MKKYQLKDIIYTHIWWQRGGVGAEGEECDGESVWWERERGGGDGIE